MKGRGCPCLAPKLKPDRSKHRETRWFLLTAPPPAAKTDLYKQKKMTYVVHLSECLSEMLFLNMCIRGMECYIHYQFSSNSKFLSSSLFDSTQVIFFFLLQNHFNEVFYQLLVRNKPITDTICCTLITSY